MCKHWGGNILRACRGLGWIPPSEAAFLYEIMEFIHSERWKRPKQELDFIDFDFSPPDTEVTEVGDGPPPIADLPPTIYNGEDNDYKSLCDLLDNAFSRLPDDWESLYEQLNWSLVAPLEAHIERTKRILGLDVQDRRDSDVGQGECPAYGEPATDEEHADPLQQQHKGDDEEPIRFLEESSAHYVSGSTPVHLGAHEPMFQGVWARLIQAVHLVLTTRRRCAGTSAILVASNHRRI